MKHESRLRRAARLGAPLYAVVVLLAVLWPSGADVADAKAALGLWLLSPQAADVMANLLMLAPLTLLACTGWPRTRWWAWALAGCCLAAAAELAQLTLPSLSRRPSWANVVQGSIGAWAGAALAIGLRSHRHRCGLRRPRNPRAR